ncbi:unnamed protein product, partial [Rotaria magnacalcarata]
AIVEIASRGAAADSTRNPDLISPCMTLDDLSKRHVLTVPARLIKASNDEHKLHDDQYFATTSINHLKTLAGSFGSDAVFF